MQHKLVIIGGGPRGLACAIEALGKFNSITIIDNEPTDSWNILSTVANFELRSPVSFDLVTYISDKREYSLSNFLYKKDKVFTTQQEIEEDPRRLNRVDFYNYLIWVKNLLELNGVQFIYDKVINVHNNTVEVSNNNKLSFDSLIIATGTIERPIPANLSPYNKISNLHIIKSDYSSLLVVGSGQGAYDMAKHLYNKGVNVGLYIDKYPRIHQYPAPSYSIWRSRSALGDYCSNLLSTDAKQRYIKSVKAWGPSITPNNQSLLQDIPIYKDVDIKQVISKYDNNYVCRIGVTPINILNIKPTDITNNFKLLNTNIYVSGPLATLYDGPRNNSIISSSIAAIKIIKDIQDNASI